MQISLDLHYQTNHRKAMHSTPYKYLEKDSLNHDTG